MYKSEAYIEEKRGNKAFIGITEGMPFGHTLGNTDKSERSPVTTTWYTIRVVNVNLMLYLKEYNSSWNTWLAYIYIFQKFCIDGDWHTSDAAFAAII